MGKEESSSSSDSDSESGSDAERRLRAASCAVDAPVTLDAEALQEARAAKAEAAAGPSLTQRRVQRLLDQCLAARIYFSDEEGEEERESGEDVEMGCGDEERALSSTDGLIGGEPIVSDVDTSTQAPSRVDALPSVAHGSAWGGIRLLSTSVARVATEAEMDVIEAAEAKLRPRVTLTAAVRILGRRIASEAELAASVAPYPLAPPKGLTDKYIESMGPREAAVVGGKLPSDPHRSRYWRQEAKRQKTENLAAKSQRNPSKKSVSAYGGRGSAGNAASRRGRAPQSTFAGGKGRGSPRRGGRGGGKARGPSKEAHAYCWDL